MSISHRFVPFTVEGLMLALPVEKVDRVIAAIEVTGLPASPDAVLGIVNIGGEVIPVFDLRRRFDLPEKEIIPEYKMLIASASKRKVAMVADGVDGVIEAGPEDLAGAAEVLPGMPHVKGVLKASSGMIVIQDLDRFLSLEEEEALDRALKAGQ